MNIEKLLDSYREMIHQWVEQDFEDDDDLIEQSARIDEFRDAIVQAVESATPRLIYTISLPDKAAVIPGIGPQP